MPDRRLPGAGDDLVVIVTRLSSRLESLESTIALEREGLLQPGAVTPEQTMLRLGQSVTAMKGELRQVLAQLQSRKARPASD